MSRVKKAIILAAGRGNRLKPRTDTVHKCLTSIHGTPILHRLLSQLARQGVEQVVIVVGYLADSIIEAVGYDYEGIKISYRVNEEYLTANNIVSLQIAKDHLNEPLLLFEADLVIDEPILIDLLAVPDSDVMVVDHFREGMNGTVVSLADNHKVSGMLLKQDQAPGLDLFKYYKTVNIYRLAKETAQQFSLEIDKCIQANGVGEYYEKALGNLISAGRVAFKAVLPAGSKWIEIDTEDDLQKALAMFKVGNNK